MIDPLQLEADKETLRRAISDLILEFERKYPFLTVDDIEVVKLASYGVQPKKFLGANLKISLK